MAREPRSRTKRTSRLSLRAFRFLRPAEPSGDAAELLDRPAWEAFLSAEEGRTAAGRRSPSVVVVRLRLGPGSGIRQDQQRRAAAMIARLVRGDERAAHVAPDTFAVLTASAGEERCGDVIARVRAGLTVEGVGAWVAVAHGGEDGSLRSAWQRAAAQIASKTSR